VVDHAVLFKPKGREGPRLADLRIQTSRYGDQIPQLFGAMRVAGTVIWATDLIEHRSTSGGGKGKPKTTTYSYSTSFAVALSARQIGSIGRIWADGNLLRGSAGDFKSPVTWLSASILASEDQALDSQIAAHQGCEHHARPSRHRLCGVSGSDADGFRQPHPFAHVRGLCGWRGGAGCRPGASILSDGLIAP
jgi:hypothetical protein